MTLIIVGVLLAFLFILDNMSDDDDDNSGLFTKLA